MNKLKFKEINKLNQMLFLFLIKIKHVTNVNVVLIVAFAPLRYQTNGAFQKAFLLNFEYFYFSQRSPFEELDCKPHEGRDFLNILFLTVFPASTILLSTQLTLNQYLKNKWMNGKKKDKQIIEPYCKIALLSTVNCIINGPLCIKNFHNFTSNSTGM